MTAWPMRIRCGAVRAPRAILAALAVAATLAALVAPAAARTARTFYVDYAAGDDAGDGLSRERPRRTVPPPKMLSPGDRILFKGGVRYGETIEVKKYGRPGAPIVYDGDSRGEWGKGRAILDGSVALGPWTRAGKTRGGLAIWRATLPETLKTGAIRLFQDGRLARIATSADVDDNWMLADFRAFFKVPRDKATDTSIVDPENLRPLQGDWDEARLLIHHGNNWLKPFAVTGFDRTSGTVFFKKAEKIRAGAVRYAVQNHPGVFDVPGEFLVRRKAGEILYIPFDGADPNTAGMRAPALAAGIVVDEAKNIEIRGFEIVMHRSAAVSIGQRRTPRRAAGVTVAENLFRNGGQIRVEQADDIEILDNRIERTLPLRPIFVIQSDRVRVEGNVVRGTPSGITAYGATNSLFKSNDVRGTVDIHGNAMTIYAGSHNTRIIGNTLDAGRSSTGLTLRESDRVLVAFNIIRAKAFTIAQWAPLETGVAMEFYNNTLLRGGVLIQAASAPKSRFVNNVVQKFRMKKGLGAFAARDHNLYGALGFGTVAEKSFRAGEAYLPFEKALADPRALDIAPRPAGRALMTRGRALDVAGMRVSHIGAARMDGRRVDVSRIGMPPHDPAVAAGRRRK